MIKVTSEQLSKLQVAAAKMVGPFNDLIRSVQDVEQALKTLRLGVTASVSGQPVTVFYGKHQGELGIYFDWNGQAIGRLASAPVNVLRAGAMLLPQLVEKLLEELETEAAKVIEATGKVHELLGEFRKAGVIQ